MYIFIQSLENDVKKKITNFPPGSKNENKMETKIKNEEVNKENQKENKKIPIIKNNADIKNETNTSRNILFITLKFMKIFN